MISSPCSAEQAQRIKLCPRKSPPQSFPPIAQQAPGHFVRGLCCSQAAQPAAEAAGAKPASNEIDTESPRTAVRGFPCASSKTRRAAGHAQPQGSSRGQGPPRMRSIQKALGHFVRGLPPRFIQNPPRGRSRTAAGELEGAKPASNEIHTESPRAAVRGLSASSFSPAAHSVHARLLLPQAQAVGDHGDELRIRRLALDVRDRVAEKLLQRLDIAAIPRDLDRVPDGALDA